MATERTGKKLSGSTLMDKATMKERVTEKKNERPRRRERAPASQKARDQGRKNNLGPHRISPRQLSETV